VRWHGLPAYLPSAATRSVAWTASVCRAMSTGRGSGNKRKTFSRGDARHSRDANACARGSYRVLRFMPYAFAGFHYRSPGHLHALSRGTPRRANSSRGPAIFAGELLLSHRRVHTDVCVEAPLLPDRHWCPHAPARIVNRHSAAMGAGLYPRQASISRGVCGGLRGTTGHPLWRRRVAGDGGRTCRARLRALLWNGQAISFSTPLNTTTLLRYKEQHSGGRS